ncbi:MAG: hypothetical protein M1834_003832 [Cirrosporium novae-zelandiae]|nr:MAG: hypothetical protein M1834_003832 [Cirrosporium novae-zelandiae]
MKYKIEKKDLLGSAIRSSITIAEPAIGIPSPRPRPRLIASVSVRGVFRRGTGGSVATAAIAEACMRSTTEVIGGVDEVKDNDDDELEKTLEDIVEILIPVVEELETDRCERPIFSLTGKRRKKRYEYDTTTGGGTVLNVVILFMATFEKKDDDLAYSAVLKKKRKRKRKD